MRFLHLKVSLGFAMEVWFSVPGRGIEVPYSNTEVLSSKSEISFGSNVPFSCSEVNSPKIEVSYFGTDVLWPWQ